MQPIRRVAIDKVYGTLLSLDLPGQRARTTANKGYHHAPQRQYLPKGPFRTKKAMALATVAF